jgi:hypothetical protein
MVERIKIPEFEEWISTHGRFYRPWTEEEELILQEYYGKIPPHMLAKKLDRTIKAIRDKADALGIKADRED